MFIDKNLIKTMNASEISHQIEELAEEIFDCPFSGTSCLFNHNYVQSNYFIDAMILIISFKRIYSREAENFIDTYSCYKRQRMDTIPNFIDIFAEFVEIFEESDKSIHYHIVIEDKNSNKYYKKNILNATKVKEIIDKYKNYDDFYIDGKNHNRCDIKSIEIKSTNGFPCTIANEINRIQKSQNSNIVFTENDVLLNNQYSVDVSDKFFNK